MKYDPKVTGERIRTERQAKKLNRDEFIEAIRNKCGYAFSTNTLTVIENGEKNKLSLDILEAMCEIFDCELGYLLGEEGYENKTRQTTDIVRATGLTELAVKVLQDKLTQYSSPELYQFFSNLICDYDATESIKVGIGQFDYVQKGRAINDPEKMSQVIKDIQNSKDVSNFIYQQWFYDFSHKIESIIGRTYIDSLGTDWFSRARKAPLISDKKGNTWEYIEFLDQYYCAELDDYLDEALIFHYNKEKNMFYRNGKAYRLTEVDDN